MFLTAFFPRSRNVLRGVRMPGMGQIGLKMPEMGEKGEFWRGVESSHVSTMKSCTGKIFLEHSPNTTSFVAISPASAGAAFSFIENFYESHLSNHFESSQVSKFISSQIFSRSSPLLLSLFLADPPLRRKCSAIINAICTGFPYHLTVLVQEGGVGLCSLKHRRVNGWGGAFRQICWKAPHPLIHSLGQLR